MKNSFFVLPLLACMGVLMVACGDSSSGSSGCADGEVACGQDCIPESDASLAWVQANVFAVNGCSAAACHDGNNVSTLEDLDLTSEQASYDSLVGVDSSQSEAVLVVESDASSSYLMNKLTGVDMAPSTQLMPIGATTPLCAAKLDGVRAWINAGAAP